MAHPRNSYMSNPRASESMQNEYGNAPGRRKSSFFEREPGNRANQKKADGRENNAQVLLICEYAPIFTSPL